MPEESQPSLFSRTTFPAQPQAPLGGIAKPTIGLRYKEKQLNALTPQDLQQWIALLKQKIPPLSPKTISRKLSVLKNYCTWLVSEGVLAAALPESIPTSRVTSPLPDILFDSECTQLLQAACADCRTYLLFLLLLETGMKKEELLALRVTHFDFSNRYAPVVFVKHEGNKVKKDRKLKLPMEIAPVFEEYVKTYGVSDLIFPFTRRFLELLLAQVHQASGVKKRVTASILRDTYAVRCLKRGDAIESVLLKLGFTDMIGKRKRCMMLLTSVFMLTEDLHSRLQVSEIP